MNTKNIGRPVVVALVVAAGSANANTIFSNSAGIQGQLNVNEAFGRPDLLFNIQTAGGGQLETITVMPNHVDFFGGAAPYSDTGRLRIYADGGGTPDQNNDLIADASLLIYEKTFTTSVLAGNTFELLTLDVTADNVVVPNNANLWIGVSFASFQTRVSTAEVGTIFNTGQWFNEGFGFEENIFSDPLTGDPAPIFDMTVIPTPTSASLLAMGGLVGFRRRR